jgi:hypothetical protein
MGLRYMTIPPDDVRYVQPIFIGHSFSCCPSLAPPLTFRHMRIFFALPPIVSTHLYTS